MSFFPKQQSDPPLPPFVVPRELSRLIKVSGSLRDAKAQRARELYQQSAFNFDVFRDLSLFGTCCAFGYYEGVVEEFNKNKSIIKIDGTETCYNWGYVSICAAGSRRSYLVSGSPLTPRHSKTIQFLVDQGAPVDVPDILGLTALHHVAMNNYDEQVLKTLLELGADPNVRDRYGCVPLIGAIMNAQAEAVGLLLEHGADPTIADAEGYSPTTIFPQATSQVQAAFQKYKREKAGIQAPLGDKTKCGACGKLGSKSQCARCKVVRYCDVKCQVAHWKAGHKQACVPFNDQTQSIFLKVSYQSGNLVSTTLNFDSLKQSYAGIQDGEGRRNGAKPRTGPTYSDPGLKPSLIGKSLIIKAQVPQEPFLDNPKPVKGLPGDMILIYNKSRDLMCYVHPEGQVEAYRKLDHVIRMQGVAGLKGYFAGEMKSEDTLQIKVGDILAAQPW